MKKEDTYKIRVNNLQSSIEKINNVKQFIDGMAMSAYLMGKQDFYHILNRGLKLEQAIVDLNSDDDINKK